MESGGVVVQADMVSLEDDGTRHALADGCGFPRPDTLGALSRLGPEAGHPADKEAGQGSLNSACNAPTIPIHPSDKEAGQGASEEELCIQTCTTVWLAPA
jgi:hypothetical protein